MTNYPRDTLVRADVFGESDVLLTYADPEDADSPWVRVSGDAAGHWIQADGVENVRPLAVFDPDDPSDMNALAKALVEAMHAAGDRASAANGVHPSTVAAALRAVSRRISEPKGRYAVVRDKHGHDWNRRGMTQTSSYEWVDLETGQSTDWQYIEEPTLVFAGVEEDA